MTSDAARAQALDYAETVAIAVGVYPTLPVLRQALAAAYTVGSAERAQRERAAIVAWLREHGTIGGKYEQAADAIARGAHLEPA